MFVRKDPEHWRIYSKNASLLNSCFSLCRKPTNPYEVKLYPKSHKAAETSILMFVLLTRTRIQWLLHTRTCADKHTHSKSLPLHDNLMVEVESGADLAAGQHELWRQVAAVVLWERKSAAGSVWVEQHKLMLLISLNPEHWRRWESDAGWR